MYSEQIKNSFNTKKKFACLLIEQFFFYLFQSINGQSPFTWTYPNQNTIIGSNT